LLMPKGYPDIREEARTSCPVAADGQFESL